MSDSMVTVAHPIETASTKSLLDASLRWFSQALIVESADVTAAFFTLEPRAQLIALDVLRTSLRAALQVADINSSVFSAASAAHYRTWLAPDPRH